MDALPGHVLFACTYNAVRSPMAESIMNRLFGNLTWVESAGAKCGLLDPFAVSAMAEVGIDMSHHRPKTFDDLFDTSFDVIVSLSPQAHHRAIELTRTISCEVEYWNTMDATIVEGNRDTRLDAFRNVRDTLTRHIQDRFTTGPPPVV